MGPLVSGNARFRLLDATMLMTSAAYTVVQVGPDSTRSVIAGMNITQGPTIVRKGPGFEILGNQYTVVDNYMVHGANQCDVVRATLGRRSATPLLSPVSRCVRASVRVLQYYTNNCAVSVVRGNNGVFSRNHVVCRCQVRSVQDSVSVTANDDLYRVLTPTWCLPGLCVGRHRPCDVRGQQLYVGGADPLPGQRLEHFHEAAAVHQVRGDAQRRD